MISKNIKSKMISFLAIILTFCLNLIASVYILQHHTSSSIKMISADIGQDLVLSNLASAERRIDIIRHMGHPGVYLEVRGFSNSNKIKK
mgnify:CR=1 FL=1